MNIFKVGDKVKFREDRGFTDPKIYTIRYEYLDGMLMQQFVKFENGCGAASINLEKITLEDLQ